MMIRIYLTCLVLLLFLNFYLVGYSAADDIKDIVDEVAKDDKKNLTVTPSPATEEVEIKKTTNETEAKSKVDPTQTYKIIAIYLIGSKPKVLIKNINNPEDPAIEYQVGDYLDEAQSFSVSKISFNPTARVEIIDLEGISYLMKPSNVDDKATSKSKPSFGAKTGPSYFSNSNNATADKSKPKKDRKDENPKNDSAAQGNIASPPHGEPAAKNQPEAAAKPAPDSEGKAPAEPAASQAGSGTSQSLQAAGSTTQPAAQNPSAPGQSPSGDATRPKNPFGE